MDVLVAGIEMDGLPIIADALSRAACVTYVFAGEADILDALAFARFDAMVLDFDSAPTRAIQLVKLHRFAALGEPPMPVIGLATRMSVMLRRATEEGVIDRLLSKPINPTQLYATLTAAVARVRAADLPPGWEDVGHGA